MDNATFHKQQKTEELIHTTGCSLIFLPPYFPDLNISGLALGENSAIFCLLFFSSAISCAFIK
ncbi:MAG: transposase [Puniceicoccales bacterium]|jgi:hypothetical protein|nr:transposase [Puniceicoccales bacterium]